MALRSCYECNKEISTKAIMCPQCGAPQNPVSGLVDSTLNVFKNFKKNRDRKKEIERQEEEQVWDFSTGETRRWILRLETMTENEKSNHTKELFEKYDADVTAFENSKSLFTRNEFMFYKFLKFEDKNKFYFDPTMSTEELEDLLGEDVYFGDSDSPYE